jgi:hypothetical protein
LPAGFTLDSYLDGQDRLALPIAKGLVSWVRKVGSHGRIEFNGAEYLVSRRLERQYVLAMLSTYHRRVVVKHDGKLIKSVPFPFKG